MTCVLAVTAGCSASKPTAAMGRTNVAAAATTTGPPPRKPVAELTAACPLLSIAELRALIGGSLDGVSLSAKENKPDRAADSASFTCEYSSRGKDLFDLLVDWYRPQDLSPAEGIAAVAQASKVTTHRVTGVGTAGVYYIARDGVAVLAVSKLSHRQTRGVIVSADRSVPERRLTDVARLVLSRI